MKRLLLAALLLSPVTALAQDTAHLGIDYPLDATTETYVCYRGQRGAFFDSPKRGKDEIETSGSSTTVTGVNAAADVFEDLGVGDAILVNNDIRVITAKASADSITVNTAINLDVTGGYNFEWWDFESGTGAEACWIPVSGLSSFTVEFALDQYTGDGNGLDWRIVCRGAGPGKSVNQIDPTTAGTYNNETTTTVQAVTVSAQFSECRVGMLHNTADDGADTGADEEQINVRITVGDRRRR